MYSFQNLKTDHVYIDSIVSLFEKWSNGSSSFGFFEFYKL